MQMNVVRRLYVEKRPGFDTEAVSLCREIRDQLNMPRLERLRLFQRYDVQGLAEAEWQAAKNGIFSEINADDCYEEKLPKSVFCSIAVEYLPGQFDQRADSAEKCLQLLTRRNDAVVFSARVYAFEGALTPEDEDALRGYLINPVDSRESAVDKPTTLEREWPTPANVATIDGFIAADDEQLRQWRQEWSLAMTEEDLQFCRGYFVDEGRDPTMTEIRVLDTYWSDHCRHTTFLTELTDIALDDAPGAEPFRQAVERSLNDYRQARKQLYGNKPKRPECLMDLALIGMKQLKKAGKLDDLDESEEINACSIRRRIPVDYDDGSWAGQDVLVMFKNETHNHPTEIEPFGGAATCLGGAIRDPLSGRAYVYQSMRVTGSGDPTVAADQTLLGKLPQRSITTQAARGFSSYGNQIGLQTGHVREIYHPGYVAKRMEIGAVVGAVPAEYVRREQPQSGDVVILLGGKTGRDGCGGATGSSKAHDESSLTECGAEVQKGNPPTERAIVRLFRKKEVTQLIKRCNDFGAGGVSVAVGELADGLDIDLDAVPKKYEGLDGTELAISESQERMAVVVAADDAQRLIALAAEENLLATVVAIVTTRNAASDASSEEEEPEENQSIVNRFAHIDDRAQDEDYRKALEIILNDEGEKEEDEPIEPDRLRMHWRGNTVVDLRRDFVDSNGAQAVARAEIVMPNMEESYFSRPPYVRRSGETLTDVLFRCVSDLNGCSQKGLVERFDGSIGANNLLQPYGGRTLEGSTEGMAALIPLPEGKTTACTVMTYGFDPELSSWSPYHGAAYAVLDSLAKLAALGGDASRARLSFQEYFERLADQPRRWGKPLAALLGAYQAQLAMSVAAIGGKDSMSGSFGDLDVPPTLVSFAIDVADATRVIGNGFTQSGATIGLLRVERDEAGLPKYEQARRQYGLLHEWISEGRVQAARAIGRGGIAEGIARMSFGNEIGAAIETEKTVDEWFAPDFGSILVQFASSEEATLPESGWERIGQTTDKAELSIAGEIIAIDALKALWRAPLEGVFATTSEAPEPDEEVEAVRNVDYPIPAARFSSRADKVRPRVLIPVFPGSNCEYDSARAFVTAGARVETLVIRNQYSSDLSDSIRRLAVELDRSQILFLPGGFSMGDEPDGSAKFIASVLRADEVHSAVSRLLDQRDGLALGICNGFQALIKLGLLPYGEICDTMPSDPTLTFNRIGRHIARYVRTRVSSLHSPWMQGLELGQVHSIPISHGEGRFVADESWCRDLADNGQIAFQYCDEQGDARMDEPHNPNGSAWAVEGLLSKDGRVLGKMGHSERVGALVARNIPGEKEQGLFAAGVQYFM